MKSIKFQVDDYIDENELNELVSNFIKEKQYKYMNQKKEFTFDLTLVKKKIVKRCLNKEEVENLSWDKDNNERMWEN